MSNSYMIIDTVCITFQHLKLNISVVIVDIFIDLHISAYVL